MEEIICNYIAQKAVDDMRHNNLPEELADVFNSYQWLGYLRRQITKGDKEWLKELALSNQSFNPQLSINLMHPIKEEPDIKDLLLSLWQSPTTDYNIKMQVMWRLLDYTELSDEMHRNIYEFVCSDWKKWLTYVVEKFGGKNKVLESSKERLQNPYFPESKAWVYLCIAAGSDDSVAAREFISNYAESKSSINPLVVKDLLNLITREQ